MITRRGLFRLLAGASAVAVAPKTYVFAPLGGWRSDVIAHSPEYIELETSASYYYSWEPYLKIMELGSEPSQRFEFLNTTASLFGTSIMRKYPSLMKAVA